MASTGRLGLRSEGHSVQTSKRKVLKPRTQPSWHISSVVSSQEVEVNKCEGQLLNTRLCLHQTPPGSLSAIQMFCHISGILHYCLSNCNELFGNVLSHDALSPVIVTTPDLRANILKGILWSGGPDSVIYKQDRKSKSRKGKWIILNLSSRWLFDSRKQQFMSTLLLGSNFHFHLTLWNKKQTYLRVSWKL